MRFGVQALRFGNGAAGLLGLKVQGSGFQPSG